MLDSVNAYNIPLGTAIVAGYVDGIYAWSSAEWARFAGSLQVPITVRGLAHVRACDCETGDLTPAQAAAWAHTETLAGFRPTIYCNTSTLPAVIAALAVYGLQFMRDVDWWQAQYDGQPTLLPYSGVTPVAKQYLDYPGNSPGPYDVSITNGVWPAVPASASILEGIDMDVVAVAPRPTSITSAPTDDVFAINAVGELTYQVNSPYWVAGQPIVLAAPPAMYRVGASWASDASALRVFALVLNPNLVTLDLYVNAMAPATLGVLGTWDKVASGLLLPK